ncbi:MAG: hypothetical protein IJM21_06430 [Clostridia bacterium]|nr:hypothetical protein [Clostridia bacterium]
METFLALTAAFGIVTGLWLLFGAVFLRAAAGRVVTLVESRTDRDLSSLLAAWISSFLSGVEVIVLPDEREKAGRIVAEILKERGAEPAEKAGEG